MPFCPECKRNRRVGYRVRKISGRRYWLTFCLECKTEIELDPIGEKDEAEPEAD
jgi:hypothetical protein